MTMQALVKTRPIPGNVELMEVVTPTAAPDEVVVRVDAAGVCGTDMSVVAWRPNLAARSAASIPLILGHEFAGTVVAESTGGGIPAGTFVTGNPQLYCGRCRWCLAGRTSICPDRPMLGISRDGTFAEYVAIRETNLYPIPAYVPAFVATLADTVAGAVHAVERVDPPRDEPALVVGCGPLGIVLGMVLLSSGVQRVFVSGTKGDEARLEMAGSLGLVPVGPDLDNDRLLELTNGEGVGAAFEVAGSPSAVTAAVSAARRGARVGLMGLGGDLSPINTADIVTREIDLVPVCAYYPSSWPRAIELVVGGELALERLVSHRLEFDEYSQAFDHMRNRDGLKVVFERRAGG